MGADTSKPREQPFDSIGIDYEQVQCPMEDKSDSHRFTHRLVGIAATANPEPFRQHFLEVVLARRFEREGIDGKAAATHRLQAGLNVQ